MRQQGDHQHPEHHPDSKAKRKEPANQWRKIVERTSHALSAGGYIANLLIGIALLCIGPAFGLLMKSAKVAIIAGAGGLTLIIWIIALVAVRQIGVQISTSPVVPSYTGHLESTTTLIGEGSLLRQMEIGDSGAILALNNSDPNMPIFRFFQEDKLLVQTIDGRIKVSTVFRDRSGSVVAEVLENDWKVKPSGIWDRNYNSSALVLQR